MVIHYQPGRLRRNSDQPTAITNVLVATSGSSWRTSEIPLGTPTCSARTRHGRWALYPNGDQVVVVWPGGALAGPPAEVARELDRLGGDAHDELGRTSARAIRQFLTDPEFLTHPAARDGTRSPAARARAWSRPAVGYGLSGPANQPGTGDQQPPSWPGAPARPPLPLVVGIPARHAQPDPSPALAPQRAA
jgi:hypothetical protein